MPKIPRTKERTATPQELEENRRLCLEAKAAEPAPSAENEGDLARVLLPHNVVHGASMKSKVHRQPTRCEICAKPGKLADRYGWRATLCQPCAWLMEMVEASKLLRGVVRRSPRLRQSYAPDAARRHLQHLGQAAKYQSAKMRARFSNIDWKGLDRLRPVCAAGEMTVAGILAFIRKQVPVIEDALQPVLCVKRQPRHPITSRRGAALAKLVGGLAKNVDLHSRVELSTSRKLPGLPGWVEVRGHEADIILDRLTHDEAGVAVATLLISRRAAKPPRHVPQRSSRPVRLSPRHRAALAYAENMARMIDGTVVDTSSATDVRIEVSLGNSRKLRGLRGVVELCDRRAALCALGVTFGEAKAILECLVFMREYRRKKRRRG
ncbi:MAG: hypothetical protein ABSB49_10375 [Polyangia bacterium]